MLLPEDMSNKATIEVQYVNQPKTPKGPGSVKTKDGVYYKVWPKSNNGGATLSQFEVGRTYEIEFDTEQYEGKDRYVARKVLSSSTTNGSNGAPTAVNTFDTRGPRIERQHAHNAALAFHLLEVQFGKSKASWDRVIELTDKFAADIDNAGTVKVATLESEKAAEEQEVEIE